MENLLKRRTIMNRDDEYLMAPFRGLLIPRGYLIYDENTAPGSKGFSLTPAKNIMELESYFSLESSKNTVYFQWGGDNGLKAKIDGENADSNIEGKITIDNEEYRIPSSEDFERAFFGRASEYSGQIVIGTTTVEDGKGYVKIVTSDGYNGVLLIPDAAMIPETLGISADYCGNGSYTWDRCPIVLRKDLETLIRDYGCRFFHASGVFTSSWSYFNVNGLIWLSNRYSQSNAFFIDFPVGRVTYGNANKNFYMPVMLVRDYHD